METLGDSGGQSQMMFLLESGEARLLQSPSSAGGLLPLGTWVLLRSAESGSERGETQTWKLKASMWNESLQRARSFQKGAGAWLGSRSQIGYHVLITWLL